MNALIKKIIENPKALINLLIISATIFLISLLFPKNGELTYEIQEGEVWNEENVYADKDLFIPKTAEAITTEKKQIYERFTPIFTRILSRQQYSETWNNLLDQYRDTINEIALEDMAGFLEVLNEREVIRKGDLMFQEKEYQTIRLKNEQNLEVLEPVNYLTNDQVSLRLSPLLSIVEDQNRFDRVTIQIDRSESERDLNQALASVKGFKRQVKKGDLIVAKGSIISSESYESLAALKRESTKGSFEYSIVFLGYILLTCLIIGVFIFYIVFHFPEVFNSSRKLGFLLMLILIMSFLVYSIDGTENLSSYLIPFCIVPIVVKSFFSDRLALFIHIVIVLIASFLSSLGYEFTFLQILAGIVAVLVIEDTRSWNKFFISILSIVAAYFIGYLGLSLLDYRENSQIDWSVYRWLTISGVLTLLAYPFIPLLAKLFGFVSTITLGELGDLNRPLLKRLSLEAPGTLQHSLQVANLSEAASDEIGANSLLLKVGALYHDIGKLVNPMAFIENQKGINPHDHLTNFESARAIIAHVTEGEKMARKSSLPEDIVDFIKTHHGTTRVEYFYRNQINQFPDKEFDETLFNYPGPKPKSKEQSILMIADSLEAASKSLKSPTGKDIDDLVDRIVDYKIKNEQFSQSELSFEEIGKCVHVFKTMLRNINHVRIEYPEVEEE